MIIFIVEISSWGDAAPKASEDRGGRWDRGERGDGGVDALNKSGDASLVLLVFSGSVLTDFILLKNE